MNRLRVIAALIVALSVPSAWAQHRGGFAGGGGHVSSFSRGAAMMNRGGGFSGFPRNNGVHLTTSFGNSRGFHHGFNHFPRRSYGSGFYPYYGYGYGLYGYDPFLWGSASSYDSSDAYYEQNQELSQQVNDLSNELARLRDEQQIRAYTPLPTSRPQAPQSPARTDVSATTVLVYRDQHHEEISNYAVVGRTLWIFNQERARKIPLADLDLAATSKVNDDRGVDFNVPR
jgi:hypothetical protein